MASQRGSKRSHHDHQPKKPPHFFKIVFSPVDRGIKIPYAFMRDYGENLEKVVVLKVPISTGGASWPVELLRTEYGTWLDKGWKEFAEYYSIREHHFLVFKYLGDSLFQFIIFDASASEIEYPFDDGIHDNDHDDSIEFLEEFPAAAAADSCHAKQGRKSADEINAKQGNAQNLDADVKGEISEGILPCSPRRDNIVMPKCLIRTSLHPFKEPKLLRLRIPSSSDSCNLLLSLKDTLWTHLPKSNHFDMDLRVSEGTKTWPVTCDVYTSSTKIVSRGWKKFVLDNQLVVGDVCVFELIKRARTFKITIYRRD